MRPGEDRPRSETVTSFRATPEHPRRRHARHGLNSGRPVTWCSSLRTTILSEDSTPEAITGLMVENHGRAAVIAAETDALDTIVGRYSKVSNLWILLKGHSGEPHRVDRRGRPTYPGSA
jgi:hypothetical protein